MQSSSTLALRAGNEHNRSPLKKKKKVLVYVVIPVLASYLENGACDQLEFISHGQTGAFFFFFSGKANDKSSTAASPACRGESDTTKADLERRRLSNIWFISTVCDPHVNRRVFEDNRSHLLQSVKVPLRAEQGFTSRQTPCSCSKKKNPTHAYIAERRHQRSIFSRPWATHPETLRQSNTGGNVQKMMAVCALMNFCHVLKRRQGKHAKRLKPCDWD